MLKKNHGSARRGWALGMTAAALVLLATPLSGQDASGPRVTISGSFGYMLGGPKSGIEAMVIAGGFGDVSQGGCVQDSCVDNDDYPITARDPGQGSNLRVGYSQWSRLELAFTMGTSTPSETRGYSQVAVPDFGRYSVMESHLRMFSPTAGVRAGPVSIGVGPAYYRMKLVATDEDNPFDETTVTKVGGLLDAGGQFVMFKKLVMDLRTQYRFVGGTDIGPLQLESRTLPATSIDFGHVFFAIGLGLRFQ